MSKTEIEILKKVKILFNEYLMDFHGKNIMPGDAYAKYMRGVLIEIENLFYNEKIDFE